MNTASAIYTTALRWARHARRSGCRFDVERKAAASLAFSLGVGAHGYVVPTKLVDVRPHAARIAQLAPLQELRLHVVRVGEGTGTPQVVVASAAGLVGRVQDKHVRWVLPLVAQDAVRCHVLRVTGGTPDRPSRGLNVVLSFQRPS